MEEEYIDGTSELTHSKLGIGSCITGVCAGVLFIAAMLASVMVAAKGGKPGQGLLMIVGLLMIGSMGLFFCWRNFRIDFTFS